MKPKRFGATWKGFAKSDDPVYKGNVVYRGPLPPDAPEYKEDWTVHIGPLLGSRPEKPSKPKKKKKKK